MTPLMQKREEEKLRFAIQRWNRLGGHHNKARSLIGELEYHRFPERGQAWGGPFNGQKQRTALFNALMERLSPSVIVETGTYLGTTTELFAKSGLPVYTVESHPRAYGFAKARLCEWRNVTLFRGDSREALNAWFHAAGAHSRFNRAAFFYLDAHWNAADLPVLDEIDLIFAHCQAAVVMIDDFQVPGDAAYEYDDYGAGKALTADYIAPLREALGLGAFYPATRAVDESGARRGCVILARQAIHGATLASLPLIRSEA